MLCAFTWTIPQLLAGSGRPGLLSPIEDDMAFAREQGIELVVTLTEKPLPFDVQTLGMTSLHFPIEDMGIATPRSIDPVCREILRSVDREQAVLVHCRAGLGRTGMMLACCLVGMGLAPHNALAHVRGINPRYVQTSAQEKLISHYAEFLQQEYPDRNQ